MDFEAVLSEVKTLLERFRKDDKPIRAETVIAEDLMMDSLQVMDLMMELEDQFDISIPLGLVPEIATVGQLTETILSCRKAA